MTLKKRSNDSDDALGTRRVKVNSLLFNLRRNYSNSLIHFFFQFIGISFWSWILKNHFQIQNLLHKTWNKTFSRHSCAVTTKRWQSVLHVQKLFLTSSSPSLLLSSLILRRPRSFAVLFTFLPAGSERDRERTRTSENQATSSGASFFAS